MVKRKKVKPGKAKARKPARKMKKHSRLPSGKSKASKIKKLKRLSR